MSQSSLIAPSAALSPFFDVTRAVADVPLIEMMRAMTEQSGRTPGSLARAFSHLSFGPGKVSFADFVRLRLFDEAFRQDGETSAFVGQRRNRDLCVQINFRHDWLGLMTNKIASASYLEAFGLPTVPITAIYAPQSKRGDGRLLRNGEDLEAFLLRPDVYPLFGKPTESYQSLGSIGLAGVDLSRRELIRHDGGRLALDPLIADICTHYAGGYLFQPMLAPHPTIAALCGQRLATARIVTIATAEGPRVFRACWKLPAGSNVADNYWRPGNLLAQLDPLSGHVRRVTSGAGLAMKEHGVHPDTGAALIGVQHPQWTEMLDLAREGARLMRHVPLIGWDLACTSDGVVVVEMNETPDLFLAQFADRRGALDEEFKTFMSYQKARASDHRRAGKALIAKL